MTACRRCNNQKASRTPEQAKMQLIAVPFTPTYAEYIFLKGRRVLADGARQHARAAFSLARQAEVVEGLYRAAAAREVAR